MSLDQNVGPEPTSLNSLAARLVRQADEATASYLSEVPGLVDDGNGGSVLPATARIDTIDGLYEGVAVLAKDKRICATDAQIAEAVERGYRTHTDLWKAPAKGYVNKVTPTIWKNILWAQINHMIGSHATRAANGKWKLASLSLKLIWVDTEVGSGSSQGYGGAEAARSAMQSLINADGSVRQSTAKTARRPMRHILLTVTIIDITGSLPYRYDSKTGEPIQGSDQPISVTVQAPAAPAAPAIDHDLEVEKARVAAERLELAELRKQMQEELAALKAAQAAAKPRRRGSKKEPEAGASE